MWLRLLLSRPVSISSIHWTSDMESGRSTPTLKSVDTSSSSPGETSTEQPANLNASVTPTTVTTRKPLRELKHGTATAGTGPSTGTESKYRTANRLRSSTGATTKKGMETVKFRNLICTTGTERLTREFRDVKCSGLTQIRELKLCDNDLFHWKFLLLPDMAPYNKNAFQAEIKFQTSYPQTPPVITVHNIYHPNVDEKGLVCLHCLSHWTRIIKIEDVLQKLFALIRDPEPHHPMRFDVADEYLKDRKVFMHKAFEAAKTYGVPRPKF